MTMQTGICRERKNYGSIKNPASCVQELSGIKKRVLDSSKMFQRNLAGCTRSEGKTSRAYYARRGPQL